MPQIVADASGLTKKTEVPRLTVIIPWGEIRAWAIMPALDQPDPHQTYFVCSATAALHWDEPANAELAGRDIQGDRRLAYQEQGRQLHALIAARTGLPLREVSMQRVAQQL